MEELEIRADEVARRILPDQPAKSRLLHDLRELCMVLIQEIDLKKRTERQKGTPDWPAISYTGWLGHRTAA